MDIGWNLGNAFDSVDRFSRIKKIKDYEQLWGSPEITKGLIDDIKKAGFTIIRIPVTWDAHIGPGPDYIINKQWIDRVRDIVDYTITNDICAIINLHHEDWYMPSEENFQTASEKLHKVWLQVAESFKNYGSQLIFEGMNEPRLIGTEYEWNGGNESARNIVNSLNDIFVKAVRSTGGNNSDRKLMVPTYAASCTIDAINALKLPDDKNIIVSIHAYIPYDFALNINGTSHWRSDNDDDTYEIDNLMNLLYKKFVSVGIPVIIGEFGAVDKNNTKERIKWSEYFVSKAARKNITCVWWDNYILDGEGERFGLYDRGEKQWTYPGVVNALMRGLRSADEVRNT